jgi:hypothetical protein
MCCRSRDSEKDERLMMREQVQLRPYGLALMGEDIGEAESGMQPILFAPSRSHLDLALGEGLDGVEAGRSIRRATQLVAHGMLRIR